MARWPSQPPLPAQPARLHLVDRPLEGRGPLCALCSYVYVGVGAVRVCLILTHHRIVSRTFKPPDYRGVLAKKRKRWLPRPRLPTVGTPLLCDRRRHPMCGRCRVTQDASDASERPAGRRVELVCAHPTGREIVHSARSSSATKLVGAGQAASSCHNTPPSPNFPRHNAALQHMAHMFIPQLLQSPSHRRTANAIVISPISPLGLAVAQNPSCGGGGLGFRLRQAEGGGWLLAIRSSSAPSMWGFLLSPLPLGYNRRSGASLQSELAFDTR